MAKEGDVVICINNRAGFKIGDIRTLKMHKTFEVLYVPFDAGYSEGYFWKECSEKGISYDGVSKDFGLVTSKLGKLLYKYEEK